jgi:hypothetical protein
MGCPQNGNAVLVCTEDAQRLPYCTRASLS